MKTFKDVLAHYPQVYRNAFGNYEPKMWYLYEDNYTMTIVLEDCNTIRFSPESCRHYSSALKIPTTCGATLELNLKALCLEGAAEFVPAIHDDLDTGRSPVQNLLKLVTWYYPDRSKVTTKTLRELIGIMAHTSQPLDGERLLADPGVMTLCQNSDLAEAKREYSNMSEHVMLNGLFAYVLESSNPDINLTRIFNRALRTGSIINASLKDIPQQYQLQTGQGIASGYELMTYLLDQLETLIEGQSDVMYKYDEYLSVPFAKLIADTKAHIRERYSDHANDENYALEA